MNIDFPPNIKSHYNRLAVMREPKSNIPQTDLKSINSKHLHSLIDASYMNLDQAEKVAQENGFLLDRRFSNDKHHVLKDRNNQVYVTFRGTNSYNDLLSDTMLGLGLEHYDNRFKNSTKLVDNVKKHYSHSPIIALGHSLGGALSEHVTDHNPYIDKSITVNKAIGLNGLYKKTSSKQHDIRSSTDPISFLSKTQKGKKTTIPKSITIDPLYAHSYKELRKFDKNQRF